MEPTQTTPSGTLPDEPALGVTFGDPVRRTTKRVHVRRLLEEHIATKLHPGDAIPSERSLVTALGVSRVTVRQAIADLVELGRLERVHGKGTYVTGPQVDSQLHLTSFSREMRERGLHPETKVLAATQEAADAEVAERLHISQGRPVVRVERLRLADGTPMAHEVGYYPSQLFPGLLDQRLDALYDVFANKYGLVVSSGYQTVRAEAADVAHAQILQIPRKAPLLVQERVTQSGDTLMEYSISWYRADRYRIHMRITPAGAGD